VADVMEVGRAIVAGLPGFVTGARPLRERPLLSADELSLRYYVRLAVADEPGVMAHVAGALAAEGVSLSQVLQSESDQSSAQIVIITHLAREGSIKAGLEKIATRTFLQAPPVLLRIEEV